MSEEIMEQIPDYISLTDDLLFHLVFTKNDRARVSLISSLLGIPESEIISAEVVNPIQLNESFDTKITVLDLNVHLNNDKHVLGGNAGSEVCFLDESYADLCMPGD